MRPEARARLRNEFGLYGRLGYSAAPGSMIYARAGMTLPRQSFQSAGGSADGGADWTLVPAFGVVPGGAGRKVGLRRGAKAEQPASPEATGLSH